MTTDIGSPEFSGVFAINTADLRGVQTTGCAPQVYDNSIIVEPMPVTYWPSLTSCAHGNYGYCTLCNTIQPTTWWPSPCVHGQTTHCCKCITDLLAALAKGLQPMSATVPNVADALLTKAKARLADIQKQLDVVPSLEFEKARLERMIAGAEGK